MERALSQSEQAGLSPVKRAELEGYLGETLSGMGQTQASVAYFDQALNTLGWRIPTTTAGLFAGIIREALRQVWYRFRLDVLHWPLKPSIEPAIMNICGRSQWYRIQVDTIIFRPLTSTFHVLNYANKIELGGETASPQQANGYCLMMLLTSLASLKSVSDFYRRKMIAALNRSQDPLLNGFTAQAILAYRVSMAEWELADTKMAIETAKKIGSNANYTPVVSLAGHAFQHQARWNEQRELATDLLAFCRRQNDFHWTNVCLWHLAETALRQGRHAEALARLDECQPGLEEIKDYGHGVSVYGMRAQICMASGEMEQARQWAEKALKIMVLPLGTWAITGYAGMVEYYLTQLEKTPGWRPRWEAMRAMLHMHVFAFVHDVGKPRLAVYQCWLAGIQGQKGRAARLAKAGLLLAQKLQLPHEEALLHYHFGRFLPSGDPARREHLTQALALFERLGAEYDAEVARALLRV